MAGMTKGKFGWHRGNGEPEPCHAAAYVPIYVKSSVLSRVPDLAISAHLMTDSEIDEFMDDAIAELEEIHGDAKEALAAAASHWGTFQTMLLKALSRRVFMTSSGQRA
jgi:hypothetical protein